MWWSAQTWTTLLGPFALHVPLHRVWLADFGLAETDELCAIMTIIAGVGIFGFFSFDSLSYRFIDQRKKFCALIDLLCVYLFCFSLAI